MVKNIAIIGGGTSALYHLRAFVAQANTDTTLDIFEAGETLGMGMPYSSKWANPEHRVNIACKELPEGLDEEPHAWLLRQSDALLLEYGVRREEVSSSFVFPRILFGKYHESQFFSLMEKARQKGLIVSIHTNCRVNDIESINQNSKMQITVNENVSFDFDTVIIATGHEWPKVKENTITGYYDSPFPLSKFNKIFNHPVGIMGSSLSAIDAIRTLARNHGRFHTAQDGNLEYQPNPGTSGFTIVMHSRRGLLPSIRYHLEHPRIKKYEYISKAEIEANIAANNGYLSLDYVFEKSYKDTIARKDPNMYAVIKDMSIEQFASYYYFERAGMNSGSPFEYFVEQLEISRASERNRAPIYWREAIEDTYYTLNFHAKSLSAEDMIRLRRYLMPLYYHAVIFMPFDSAEELVALYEAGKLNIITLGQSSNMSTCRGRTGGTFTYKDRNDKNVQLHYNTVIDCRGQRQLPYDAFPFRGLIKQGVISPARVEFTSSINAQIAGNKLPEECFVEKIDNRYFLRLPGVAFNDDFQAIDTAGRVNSRIYIIANAYIKGMNPDLSGIPFCKDSAEMIMDSITK